MITLPKGSLVYPIIKIYGYRFDPKQQKMSGDIIETTGTLEVEQTIVEWEVYETTPFSFLNQYLLHDLVYLLVGLHYKSSSYTNERKKGTPLRFHQLNGKTSGVYIQVCFPVPLVNTDTKIGDLISVGEPDIVVKMLGDVIGFAVKTNSLQYKTEDDL